MVFIIGFLSYYAIIIAILLIFILFINFLKIINLILIRKPINSNCLPCHYICLLNLCFFINNIPCFFILF